MIADVTQRECSNIKYYASAFSNIQIEVITKLKFFIRFGLLLKVIHFVVNSFWSNCQKQLIFDIIVKGSYYDLLSNNKKYLIKKR